MFLKIQIIFSVIFLILFLKIIFPQTSPPIETGVSQVLAKWRAANYSNVRSRFFCLCFLIFVFAIPVFSQNTAEVKLSLADGKTVYKAGEPIRLILTFTANGGEYNLLVDNDKIEFLSDEIFLSSKDKVFDWAAQYARGNYMMKDSFGYTKLSDKPIKIEFTLNDKYRFDKPGKFSVFVKTKRISTGHYAEKDWSQPALMTNSISFEVKPMSEAEEAEEVERLSNLLDAKNNWQTQSKAAEELSYLTGDVSTREKVRRYFTSQKVSPGNYFQNIYFGLFIARNQELVIKLLEEAFRDPNREANFQLLTTLVAIRLFHEESKSPSVAADINTMRRQREKRAAEIRRAYLDELVASLPKRTGENRTKTAIAILQSLPGENPPIDTLAKVREILLKDFDTLNILDQEYLLRAYWENLRDSSLLPAIEQMLNNKSLAQMYSGNVRATALKRLIELDESKARPFVIQEIRNPNSFVDVDVLSSLSDEFLPETDDALLEQIREIGQMKTKNRDYVLIRQKSLLAARYATANIYAGLLEVYKTYGNTWSADSKGALLGYFARHNGEEAVELTGQALAKLGNESYFGLFTSLTKMNYSPKVNEFFRKILDGNDSQMAGTAAYLMSKYGDLENRKFIQARYDRWLKEWSGRAAELDRAENNNAEPDSKIRLEGILQMSLIEALITAKAWKLSDAEIEKLKKTCVTRICRRRYPN